MNEDTLEIIYKCAMTVWYYLPLLMLYFYFVVNKDGKKVLESKYADKCIKMTQDYYQYQYRMLEKKLTLRIEHMHKEVQQNKRPKKTFEIKAFKKRISRAA